MKNKTPLLCALAAIVSPLLMVGTAAGQDFRHALRLPFRFEFSPVEVRRGNAYDHHDHRNRHHRTHAQAGCGCGSHERIKLIGGHQRGKSTRPSGWHTRGWFESRGYDLANYIHKHEHSGKVHRGSRVRSRR